MVEGSGSESVVSLASVKDREMGAAEGTHALVDCILDKDRQLKTAREQETGDE